VQAGEAELAIQKGFSVIEQAQSLWSFQSPNSELTKINQHPSKQIPIHKETMRLLCLAKKLMQLSEGRFNITLGGNLVKEGVLPDLGGPDPIPYGISEDIELGDHWVCLKRPVRLVLDGIAKGYAVDWAVRQMGQMRDVEISGGWVNAGGDIRVFGDIVLPIHRRELDHTLTPLGNLTQAAIATSRVGEYNPQFPTCLVGGKGESAMAGVWTVMARSAWRADALTKVAANVADSTERERLIQQLGGFLLS
jgi:thiamine biosynthesis lipoprotein